MSDIVVSENGMRSLLQSLRSGAASRPDSISNLVSKKYARDLSKFLVILLNKSFKESRLPPEWKLVKAASIHKSDAKNVTNYKQISLTSVCCKTIKHIVYSSIIRHLEINKFFTPPQHGFRSGFFMRHTAKPVFPQQFAFVWRRLPGRFCIFLFSKSLWCSSVCPSYT